MLLRHKFLLFTLCILLMRGPLYRIAVRYHAVSERQAIALKSPQEIQVLDQWLAAHPQPSAADIAAYARAYTTRQIHYTWGKCSTNPNQILQTHQSNCIGYSALFQAVADYLVDKSGQRNRIQTAHKIAHLYLLGYNVHPWLSHPAWKDHDFNTITDLESGTTIAIDPTLSDYLWINTVVF